MKSETIIQFQNKLLEWYDNNARILPWRDNPSPYRVWISEIMLQQTRVNAVKPYFENFMKEVPTIQTLANISEDKLLKLWEGLGYYNRAKNLKNAANIIVQSFGGEMPSSIEDLQSLPGIGPYSSGAIASIAFGRRVPAIDGNVLRVFARVTANEGSIIDQTVKKEIEKSVVEILPMIRIGDFNQAIMELGATICVPNGLPKCIECPINTICEGNKQGIAATLPLKTKKKARKIEEKTIFVIRFMDRTALRQRGNKGLLSSLWEFPHVEGHLSREECEEQLNEWNIICHKIIPLNKSKHIFTHIEWHMIGYFIQIESMPVDTKFVWATQNELKEKYSIPSAFRTYRGGIDD
ncbi:MAG: A/G-specific adenine glycosylase [Firmicutes bacterium HGW-Firmicutes-1]|jgi:A/G-specific adenine glycosylase|nr:MAG: A/G-specific adenine glycosylase [Firmicutes bacterium HGW-Firmicutes-1]